MSESLSSAYKQMFEHNLFITLINLNFNLFFLLRQNTKLSENYPLTDTLKVHKVAHSTIVITF